MNQPPQLRAKWFIALAAVIIFYWLALLTATHIPLARSQTPSRSLDKLGHFAAFALLAALLCCAALALWRPTARLYASIFAVVIGYGALDELSQRFTPSRSSDFRDWIADCAGAAIGILGFALFHRLIIRPQPLDATPDRAG